MTDYYELPDGEGPKFVAWRISSKSNCSAYFAAGYTSNPYLPCRYQEWCDGDELRYHICFHPQAQGNNRGWLVACPGREEAK